MPHDRNGKLLGNGDRVLLVGTVDLISTNPDRCNLRILVDDPGKPDGKSFVHVDSCLTELVAQNGEKATITISSDRMPARLVGDVDAEDETIDGGDVVEHTPYDPSVEDLATSA